jgi:hypothetical protein
MTVDWLAFGLVVALAFVAAVAVVALYAAGLRALGPSNDRPRSTTLLGYACMVVAAGIILFGIYLLVPLFH